MGDPRSIRSRNRRGQAGFSLVELLVAATVLVVVLGIVAIYFGEQSRLARRTQARSDAQDRARLVMQLVTQDLSLAGAKTYIQSDGSLDLASSIATCPDYTAGGTTITPCFLLSNHGAQDSLSMMYVNSLRSSSQACRTVAYRFNGNTLERIDTSFTCSATPPSSTPRTRPSPGLPWPTTSWLWMSR